MGNLIVRLVAMVTLNRVRGQRYAHGAPDLKWWWTPWTYHCQHGGWVCLSRRWLREYWQKAPDQQARFRRESANG